jgi:hypothetical protein
MNGVVGSSGTHVDFEIMGEIAGVESIAVGPGIRNLRRLRKRYGPGRWRKCKGFAKIRLPNGELELAEIHWYAAAGIGKQRHTRCSCAVWMNNRGATWRPDRVTERRRDYFNSA